MSSRSKSEEFTPEQLTADQIRSQMRQRRLELDAKADQLAEGTNSLSDWQQYVKARPLVAFAASAVVGYLLIPATRHYINPDPEKIARLIRKDKLVVAPPGKVKRSGGVVAGLTGSMLRLGMQTAAGVIMQKLGAKAAPSDNGTNQ